MESLLILLKSLEKDEKINTIDCQHWWEHVVEDFSTIVEGKILKPVNWKITYWVEWYSKDFTKTYQNVIFNNMFTYWSDVLKWIFFQRVYKERDAQVKIYWRKNWDKDLPVEFKPQTIAYAFAPYGWEHSWKMFINDDKLFDIKSKEGSFQLLKVLTHECWHLLNVKHSEDEEDIMYPSYQRNKEIKITQDTIDGLRGLYKDYI